MAEVATRAQQTAHEILALREEHRTLLAGQGRASRNLLGALDRLFERPLVTARMLERDMDVSFATGNNVNGHMVKLGMLTEITGNKRHRRFTCAPYVALFEESDRAIPEGAFPITQSQSES